MNFMNEAINHTAAALIGLLGFSYVAGVALWGTAALVSEMLRGETKTKD